MIRLIPQKPKGQKQFLQIIADMEKLKYDWFWIQKWIEIEFYSRRKQSVIESIPDPNKKDDIMW